MNLTTIDRLDDPRLAAYRDIRDRTRLLRDDQFLAEGRETVSTLLLHSSFRARSVLLTEVALEALRPALTAYDAIDVFVATGQAMTELTGIRFQQGCVALGDAGPRLAITEILDSIRRDGSLIVALENVSNPDNVGSIFRNAFAFGADAVLLGPGCASALYRKTIRTSMGAVLRVPFCQDDDWPAMLAAMNQAGYERIALSPRPQAPSLGEHAARWARDGRPIALIAGNEGEGLSSESLAAVDREMRIEMAPQADSVNVATATGIALHWLRQTNFPAKR